MSEEIVGNPEKLVEEALRGVEEELRLKLREVGEGAYKMINDAFREAFQEASEEVSRRLSEAQEKLKAEEASLEAELRLKKARKRSQWIDKVLEEAERRLTGFFQSTEYRQVLEKLAVQAAYQIESDRIVLEVNERDKPLVEEIVEELRDPETVKRIIEEHSLGIDPGIIVSKNIEIDERPANIIGGLRARTPDSRIDVDYSLDLIESQIARDMRARIARILFGGGA